MTTEPEDFCHVHHLPAGRVHGRVEVTHKLQNTNKQIKSSAFAETQSDKTAADGLSVYSLPLMPLSPCGTDTDCLKMTAWICGERL